MQWADAPLPPRWRASALPPNLPPAVKYVPFAARAPAHSVVLRLSLPPNGTAAVGAVRTAAFAPAGMLCADGTLAGGAPLAFSDAILVAQSRWVAEGLLRSGAPAERVALAPLGVNVDVFAHRSTGERLSSSDAAARASDASVRALRRGLGWGEAGEAVVDDGEGQRMRAARFAFLHVAPAAATVDGANGRPLAAVVEAFADVLARWPAEGGGAPEPVLVLLGLGSATNEAAIVGSASPSAAGAHTMAHLRNGSGRVVRLGGAWPEAAVAQLFRACDALVTAEGADGYAPDLSRAAAAGLVVIAPSGAAVEELVDESFALLVPSELADAPGAPCGLTLRTSQQALARAMLRAATDRELRGAASVAGPRHARERLRMETTVDVLLGILQDDMWPDDQV